MVNLDSRAAVPSGEVAMADAPRDSCPFNFEAVAEGITEAWKLLPTYQFGWMTPAQTRRAVIPELFALTIGFERKEMGTHRIWSMCVGLGR